MRATPVEQRLVRLGPQGQVLRGLHGGLGEARIDDDDRGVAAVAQHALPQDGVRDARVGTDEDDDVRLFEVPVGVGRRVEPERLLVGDHRRRHALPGVPIAVQHAHAQLSEGAEQGHLLGRQLPGAEERQRPRSVPGLDRLEPLDHRSQPRRGGTAARQESGTDPRPRRVGHGQPREETERHDLAAEPRVPQPDDGPECVLRAAQVKDAHRQGEQAEHQGADAVQGPDARHEGRGHHEPEHLLDEERADRQLRQRQHQDERPVRGGGVDRVVVGRDHVARQDPRRPVGGRRQRDLGLGRTRDEQVGLRLLHHLVRVHHPDADGLAGARLDARGGLPGASPSASRSPHMSHFRTMPFAGLYFGAS